MSKSRMIGSSNQFTNNTCAFGSMAGLAPTANVRPNITGTPGYYVTATAGNMFLEGPSGGVATAMTKNTTYRSWGCGLGGTCAEGKECLTKMKLMTSANSLGGWSTGGGTKLLG
ncbi:hypothetical protein PGAG_00280 [Phaeocystis globosa virus 12T]|uniref:Uncharacterized protein n=1 Tax=Phaeocystis globosa virus PgV-16T TaxID=3071227 RepID=A0AC59EXD0_9VIRU|nr:hypothetical protein PGCG_00319 [Phaeocystis globosa virus]AET73169.1 hypothetical protein PGAG_00280 [Phaeocystis globosa virus 12T]AET73993.1 hypothetical protein PGBG_00285 [Phaeocystis globosa virus 14T]AGM15630.1 hypothetical protein PGCG_00319 [Phaeocystis globosa virus PgV-16T]UYE94360.1 hypothetical protein PGV14T_00319 [Phaeocystis globosa virus]